MRWIFVGLVTPVRVQRFLVACIVRGLLPWRSVRLVVAIVLGIPLVVEALKLPLLWPSARGVDRTVKLEG